MEPWHSFPLSFDNALVVHFDRLSLCLIFSRGSQNLPPWSSSPFLSLYRQIYPWDTLTALSHPRSA
ncbi:hypothetical protein ACLOJK_022117, partial [Asimina triloba]